MHEELLAFDKALSELNINCNRRSVMPLTRDLRFSITQALGTLMSEVSEFTWAAGWFSGTEDLLPPIARKLRFETFAGPWICTPIQAKAMRDIADFLGHWAKYDPEYDIFMPYVPQSERGAYKPKNSSRSGE